MKRPITVSRASAAAFVLASLALAPCALAAMSASCSFGSCSAQISESTMSVSCAGKQIYSGAFSITTNLQSAQVAADPAGDPSITAQAIPAAGAKTPATLNVAGQATAGTCTMTSGSQP